MRGDGFRVSCEQSREIVSDVMDTLVDQNSPGTLSSGPEISRPTRASCLWHSRRSSLAYERSSHWLYQEL
jgi:hypothetical protein